MEQGSETEIDALLSEQAAGWFVRLVANDLSPRERREYLAWLKTSDRQSKRCSISIAITATGAKRSCTCARRRTPIRRM
ncbi:hypothetical protein GCM10011487_65950 [Steroidobacter agaridevorans]|uniref:FecR N-terminal domain-containing protein n=1 Tax=Steroidobacter agaridevorans TaxID=2695856 RepID=A0A829YMP5_9GAMM|nr:hypothetical protein GCM10011487_65950 [Steroidobacter agaridevorans]